MADRPSTQIFFKGDLFMTDSEFLTLVDSTLVQVEEYIESLADGLDLDADSSRSGHVLTLDFADKGKMILNSQVANHELWLAAKAGGFHYAFREGMWVNTRTDEPFSAQFVALLSGQVGEVCPPLGFDM
jgi:CyaY protein